MVVSGRFQAEHRGKEALGSPLSRDGVRIPHLQPGSVGKALSRGRSMRSPLQTGNVVHKYSRPFAHTAARTGLTYKRLTEVLAHTAQETLGGSEGPRFKRGVGRNAGESDLLAMPFQFAGDGAPRSSRRAKETPHGCRNHLDKSFPQRWQSASGLSSALSCSMIVPQIAPGAHSSHPTQGHIDRFRFPLHTRDQGGGLWIPPRCGEAGSSLTQRR